MHQRLQNMRDECKLRMSSWTFTDGIRGVVLNLDFLRDKGVSPCFLRQWRDGIALSADVIRPRHRANHPSMKQHDQWAEIEWSRLERLGKVTCLLGTSRPDSLNVNPCASILKEQHGASNDAPETDRYKARLIVDLRRGGVNPHLPAVEVHYGTVEQAVLQFSVNDFIFILDLQDCFFNWRVAPTDAWLLGFYSPARRQFGKFEYLPNGLKSAPGINDGSVKEILRVLKLNTDIHLRYMPLRVAV